MHINAHIGFDGQCAAAFKFYEECLRGTIEFMMAYGDSPMADKIDPNFQERIMHASLKVGDQTLMGADAPHAHPSKPQGFCVALSLSDPAEAERIYTALSENGTIQVPMAPTFWALKFGMLTDRFGIPWMINCAAPMPSQGQQS